MKTSIRRKTHSGGIIRTPNEMQVGEIGIAQDTPYGEQILIKIAHVHGGAILSLTNPAYVWSWEGVALAPRFEVRLLLDNEEVVLSNEEVANG